MGVYGESIRIDDPFFRPLKDDRLILIQAIIMRLSTKRGTYWMDTEYGLLVSDYLNEGLTPEVLARIPFEVQAELEKDERIGSVEVSATATGPTSSKSILLAIFVTPRLIPPFSLTLSVPDLTVEILTRGAQ